MVHLRYGAKEVLVHVCPVAPEDEAAPGLHPSAPATVVVSPKILEYLYIHTEPVYQLRLTDGTLEIGPVLGLLLGNRNHWYDHAYLHREPERVADVYDRTGGLFCAFSPRTVSLKERCAYGLFYDPREDRWRFGKLPIPMVMHKRSFHHTPAAVDRLRYATGAYIFNSRRFNKYELYEILRQDAIFIQHLPETNRVGSFLDVFDLVDRHQAVILKPPDLSRGRGILFVEQNKETYRLIDCRTGGRTEERDIGRHELEAFLSAEIIGRRYICQQRIDLARISGAPFDIRIVMQRNRRGLWHCTGIECRLAGAGLEVTNIAHGGCALRIETAVRSAFGGAVDPTVAEGTVIELSERFCHLMDDTGEFFAEFGIDMALDRSGAAWFIEANVLPTFKGFKAIDPEIYQRILAAPLLYANYVAGFGEAGPIDSEKGEDENLGVDL